MDVVQSVHYPKAVVGTSEIHGDEVMTEDVSAALEYEASVIAAENPAGAPPAWFTAAMGDINITFYEQRDAIANIRGETRQLGKQLVRIDRTSAILHNRGAVTGSKIPFQEVPFPDGTYPTKADIKNMQNHHIKKYHQKYCPGAPEDLEKGVYVKEVLEKIGCYL